MPTDSAGMQRLFFLGGANSSAKYAKYLLSPDGPAGHGDEFRMFLAIDMFRAASSQLLIHPTKVFCTSKAFPRKEVLYIIRDIKTRMNFFFSTKLCQSWKANQTSLIKAKPTNNVICGIKATSYRSSPRQGQI